MLRHSALGSVIVSACLFVGGCDSAVTQENYAQIKSGMTLTEVEKVMGSAGEKQEVIGMSVSGAGIASGSGSSNSQRTYIWKEKNAEISVTVDKDGKVLTASCRGL